MRKQDVMLYPPEIASNFIAEQEGFKPMAYKCPAGVWTIGFGHTKNVHANEHITKNEAYELLSRDLIQTQEELAAVVKVPVTENQYVALMSWLFNLGLTPTVRNSALLRKLNAGDYAGAANEFPRWRKSGNVVLPGLVRRRNAERELFLKS